MYGIDLGTTNSIIGLYDANTKTSNLSPLVPSFVNLRNGISGNQAKMAAIKGSKDVTFSYKTNLPRSYSKLASYGVLKELKRMVNDTNKSVAISVPAYFNSLMREATIEAANKAGYEDVYIINEPTAAILAYGIQNKGLFITYDLGGGTFDVTIMKVTSKYTTLGTYGCNLGGDDLDRSITTSFMGLIRTDFPEIEFTEEDINLIKLSITEAKHELQRRRKDTSFYFMGKEYVLTTQMYSSKVYETFRKTLDLLDMILEDYKDCELNMILVGGSTRDPYLVDLIEQHCKLYEYNIRILPETYNKDTLVAQGVAYAAYLYETGELNIITDICDSIGVDMLDHNGNLVVQNIINKNAVIPTKSTIMLGSVAGQETVDFCVYKGQITGQLPKEDCFLGSIEWKIKNPSVENIFILTVSVDINGVATFEVTQKGYFDKEEIKLQ